MKRVMRGADVMYLALIAYLTMPGSVAISELTQTHGFRVDPMQWVEADVSLQGAMVRCSVFGKPKAGDRDLVRSEIRKDLAEREKEAKEGKVKPGRLILLAVAAEMGFPEVQKIGKLILEKGERDQEGDTFNTYRTRALCHAGFASNDVVKRSVERRIKTTLEENPWHCCPWGAFPQGEGTLVRQSGGRHGQGHEAPGGNPGRQCESHRQHP